MPIEETILLPTGEDTHHLQKYAEWESIRKRLGQPRIPNNLFLPDVLQWYNEKFSDTPQDFSFFEAGCGHGNDLRALREMLGGEGYYLGVNMSQIEILRGIDHYKEQRELGIKSFAQGNLRDLKNLFRWDEGFESFSIPFCVEDNSFDLVHMEAVLHGLGHGEGTYQGKKQAAQKMLNELFRICKSGGRFFGRANVFRPDLSWKERMQFLQEAKDWHFVPGAEEFKEMLDEAGFKMVEAPIFLRRIKPIDDPVKKNDGKIAFLAEKG